MSLLFFILLDGMQILPGVSGLAIERSQLSLSCPRMHLSSGHSWRIGPLGHHAITCTHEGDITSDPSYHDAGCCSQPFSSGPYGSHSGGVSWSYI